MFQKTYFPFGGYSQTPAGESPVVSIPVQGSKKLSKNGWKVVSRW